MAKSRRRASENADDPNNNGGADIRFDDFIRQVRPTPESTDQIVVVHGYVGESTSEEKIRLYSDANLADYVEINLADIVYSIPNEEDPLGGSSLWVKVNASMQYSEGAGYGQGDMYNDYMANAYTPGYGNMGPVQPSVGPAGCQVIITNPRICFPSKFACPTPASRAVICNLPNTRNAFCPVTVGPACPRPSWVDACPSQFGCNPATDVINPGGGQFAGNYAAGDMYNDYMLNQYEGGGYNNFGPQAATGVQICLQPITQQIVCKISLNCFTRKIWCRITPNNIRSICRPCWVTPPVTIPQTTPQTPVNPGGGGGYMNDPYGSNSDYTGGDLYNDYMQNQYTPDYENYGPGITPNINVASVFCASRFFCITRNNICRITPNNIRSICRPCWVTPPITPHTPVTPGPIGGGGLMNDPYGGYGGDPSGGYSDYTGGELYNDYMNTAYGPETGIAGVAGQPVIPNLQTRILAVCRPSVVIYRCPTNHYFPPCNLITRPWYPPCGFSRQITICTCPPRLTLQQCPPPTPGFNAGGFGGGYDPYGFGY